VTGITTLFHSQIIHGLSGGNCEKHRTINDNNSFINAQMTSSQESLVPQNLQHSDSGEVGETVLDRILSNQIGSQGSPFNVLIIGGGPAGVSIIVRAIRLGLFEDLCNGSSCDQGAVKGICILDKDTPDRFGCGKLQDYEVRCFAC